MKNLISVLIMSLVIGTFGGGKGSYAYLKGDTVLYDAAGGEAVAVLPATYFVMRLSDSEQNGYILVNYLDLNGFVKLSDVEEVDYEPRTKYADASFTVSNDGQNARLRSAPDHTDDDNVLAEIKEGGGGRVYGKAHGSSLIPALGDEWYYVAFTENGVTKYGYIYSGQILPVEFTENVVEPVENPPDTGPEVEDPSPTLELSAAAEAVIAVSLTVPSVAITFLLFKRTPKKRKPQA